MFVVVRVLIAGVLDVMVRVLVLVDVRVFVA